jgi:hypothetical protein
MMAHMGRRTTWLGALGAAVACAAPVYAQDVHQCVGAHARMQELYKTSKLMAAREAATACEAAACPTEVRSECAEYKRKIESALPTLTIRVTGVEPGSSGFVEVDGEIALPRLEEKAIRVDPGQHALRVELGDGRVARSSVSIAAGESKTVELAVPPGERPPPDADASADVPAPSRGLSAPVWIAGGIGLVGVLAGSYFGLRAISLKNDSEEHCPSDDRCFAEGLRLRDDAQTAATISTVAFAIGIAGLGTAVTLVLVEPSADGEGAMLGVRGAF